MEFKFQVPTKILFGKECLLKNKGELGRFGKKALIVTGRSSAKESGALKDICMALEDQGIEYDIFNRVENNPSLESVEAGGVEASRSGADFIIGIGGGSPLDAAKAVAVLAVNKIDPLGLFNNVYPIKPLPVIAIPTTAGTGSEVTPYSILTRDDLETKMSFGNQDTIPAIAFMDVRYTESMPLNVTVNTAIDALSHAMEGYLNKKSTPLSDMFAIEAISLFGQSIQSLNTGKYDYCDRERLLYMAMVGGIVIASTGTTIMHGMGYNLTYFKGLPHGKANGLLMEEYLRYNYGTAQTKIDNMIRLLGLRDIDELGKLMKGLLGVKPPVVEQEILKYSELTMKQRSTLSNVREVVPEDIAEILRKTFA